MTAPMMAGRTRIRLGVVVGLFCIAMPVIVVAPSSAATSPSMKAAIYKGSVSWAETVSFGIYNPEYVAGQWAQWSALAKGEGLVTIRTSCTRFYGVCQWRAVVHASTSGGLTQIAQVQAGDGGCTASVPNNITLSMSFSGSGFAGQGFSTPGTPNWLRTTAYIYGGVEGSIDVSCSGGLGSGIFTTSMNTNVEYKMTLVMNKVRGHAYRLHDTNGAGAGYATLSFP